MKIVTIGGGTGGSVIDESLASEYPDLVSIVTSFDNGGSSGLLRKEFGMLPQGDIRRRIFAQKSTNNKVLEEIYNFRFGKSNSLESHSVGNLMILAATKIWGEKQGIKKVCELFEIKGKVLPITYDHADLAAKLFNGQTLIGEELVGKDLKDKKIEKVYLTRDTKVNEEVLKEIAKADYIILAPGDFYTSLIPNFLVPGFCEEIMKAKKKNKNLKIIYVVNIMTKAAETRDFKLSDFISETEKYLGQKLDIIMINKTKINKKLLARYKKYEDSVPVENDLVGKDLRVIEVDMIKQNGVIRHDKKLFLEAFKNIDNASKKSKLFVFDLDDTLINSSKYYDEFLVRDFKNLKFIKNVNLILEKFKKENCILLTYDMYGLQQEKIKILNLKKYFKQIVIVKSKKDKYTFLKNLKQKNQNKNIYVVGDAHENGELEYGKKLELKTICVALPGSRNLNIAKHKNYDFSVESGEDFLKLTQMV